MKWGERVSVLCLLLLFPFFYCYAQQPQRGLILKGKVVDEQNRPIETAYVILNGTYYTLTDAKGNFTLKNLPAMKGECTVSCVGYDTRKLTVDVKTASKKTLLITLQTANLALKQVTVTAKQEGMGSRSEIGQDAIRHIQAKSIGDVMQLMPGALTVNPTLNNLSQAYVREIESNDNNALGTQIIVDGAPLSNDANLQVISQTQYGNRSGAYEDGMSNQTTAGRGVDLRMVSADNIESVEVIRGIPSAEYGNLTSGIVIVKTKAGRTPLEAKFKADPFSKLAWAGKGFNLRSGGAINLGSDIAGTQYDVAHVKWGGSWVMPSREQQDELRKNCTYKWTTMNGVKGGKFTSKTNGGSIFLPAAGYRFDSDLYYVGSYGYYWSSTQYPSFSNYAYILYFGSGSTDWGNGSRGSGLSIRPVVRN